MTNTCKQALIFAENQRLETERLVLRPVTLADALEMFAYASDEKMARYVFPVHQSLQDTKESIATYFMAAPFGKYGLIVKETGQFIGTIDLRVNASHANGELGYALSRAFWGQGYMPEAASELLRFGFEKLDLIRIGAVHDQDNPKSGRVMEKIGMKKEGKIPNARIVKGKISTDIVYGITIEAWQQRIEQVNKLKGTNQNVNVYKD